MEPVDLAVIGYGSMSSRTYCPLLHTLVDRVRLGGLVEPDETRRAEACRTYAFSSSHASVAELLDNAPPQAALVLAPAEYHADLIRPLLQAGVDVYTEKPDTYPLAVARELVELARERRLIYQVGQNRLFMTALTRAKDFLADTPVDFIHVEKSKTVRRTDPGYLFDDGIHVMSPLLWLAGEVDEVLSAVHIPQRMLSAHFKLASGGAANLVMHGDDGYWVERFLIHAQGRSVNISAPDTIECYANGEAAGSNHVGRMNLLFNQASLMGFQAAVSHFLDCVETREEPLGSAASLLRVHELMNQVFTLAGIPTL
ncbi:MAG: Gfo/Idh/MocA family oxidoreductase [Armatimonadia bacterium]